MENLEKYIKNTEKYKITYLNQAITIITLKDKNDNFVKSDFINLIKLKIYDVYTNQKGFKDKITELEIRYKPEYVSLSDLKYL